MNQLVIPKHIAIIMDGNGRWAKKKMMPKKLAHYQGSLVAEKITNFCKSIGVKYLTLYAFSIENWMRDPDEIKDLMQLLRDYLNDKASKLVESGIRIIFIGDRALLDDDIVMRMNEIEEISSHNAFTLMMAISYGSRHEIASAAKRMALHVIENNISQIDDNLFEKFLNPKSIPDPDLLIRTSGEQRLSNFLLWQIAYSELYFTNKLWPDFTEDDIVDAIKDFTKRERRYGK